MLLSLCPSNTLFTASDYADEFSFINNKSYNYAVHCTFINKTVQKFATAQAVVYSITVLTPYLF
jgi:hypothetical protein